jgi:GntR family transcriptional regulator
MPPRRRAQRTTPAPRKPSGRALRKPSGRALRKPVAKAAARRRGRLWSRLNPAANADLPAYVLLANHLRSQIQQGGYPVSSLLPTEMALCARYKVSRYTVREALRRLNEEGLVARYQGVGTYVLAARSRAHYLQHVSSIADLLQYTQETYLEITGSRRIRADRAMAQMLGSPRGVEWVHLTATRRAMEGNTALCVTDIYLRPAFRGIQRLLGKSRRSIYGLIEERFGHRITEIEQDISAEAVQARDAKALDCEAGQPALKTVRRFYDEKRRLLEVSVSIHPAPRFSYTMRLQRDTLR